MKLKTIVPIFSLPDWTSNTQKSNSDSQPAAESITHVHDESETTTKAMNRNSELPSSSRTIGEITFCSAKDISSEMGLSTTNKSSGNGGGSEPNQKQPSSDVDSNDSNDSDAMVIDLQASDCSPKMGPIKSPIKIPRKTEENGIKHVNRNTIRPKVMTNKEIGISLSSGGLGRESGIGGTLEIRDPSNGTTVRITLHNRTPSTDTVVDSQEMSPSRVPVVNLNVPGSRNAKDPDVGTDSKMLNQALSGTQSTTGGKKDRTRKQSTPRKVQKHHIGDMTTNNTTGSQAPEQSDLIAHMESGYESDTTPRSQEKGHCTFILGLQESQRDLEISKLYCHICQVRFDCREALDLHMQNCHSYESVNKQGNDEGFKSEMPQKDKDNKSNTESKLDGRPIGSPFICKFCAKNCEGKREMFRHFRVCEVKRRDRVKYDSSGQAIQAKKDSAVPEDTKETIRCPFCDVKQSNMASYEHHVIKHHSAECKRDGGVCVIPAGIKIVEPKESIKCPNCGLKFTFRSEFENHVKKRHKVDSITNEKRVCEKVRRKRKSVSDTTIMYTCHVCQKEIEGKDKFREHVKDQCTHVSYVCSICGSQMFQLHKFIRHKNVCKERQKLEQEKLREISKKDVVSGQSKSHSIAKIHDSKSINVSRGFSTSSTSAMTEPTVHRDPNNTTSAFKGPLGMKREPIKIRKCQICNVSCIGNKGLMLHLKSTHPGF